MLFSTFLLRLRALSRVKKSAMKCQKFAIRVFYLSFAFRPFAAAFRRVRILFERRGVIKSADILLPTLDTARYVLLCGIARTWKSAEEKKEDFTTRAKCRWKAERRPFRRLHVNYVPRVKNARNARWAPRYASPDFPSTLRSPRDCGSNEPGQAQAIKTRVSHLSLRNVHSAW